ncbi:Ig domain-containing protein [Candidatus Hydrogenedentota bacterium]
MKRRGSRETNVYSAAFLDVLSNTIGGLAFLLILAIIMIGGLVFVPPKITTEELPEAYHRSEYKVWLGAREGLGKYEWRLGEGELPDGLELKSDTGELSGKPELSDDEKKSSEYEFEIICEATTGAEESQPRTDARKYKLTIHRKHPQVVQKIRIVTEEPLPQAYMDLPYPLTFAAEKGIAPYTWECVGEPPPGMRLSTQGRIEGMPAEKGTYQMTVRVRSAMGDTDEKSFTVDIAISHPPVPPLHMVTDSLPDAVAKRKYVIFPSAYGGLPPYSWSIETGKPSWLSVSSDTFTGTPSLEHIAQSTVTLVVRDAKGVEEKSEPIPLTVLPPPGEEPLPLELLTKSLPDSIIGHEYQVALSATGGYFPYTWSLQGDFADSGLSFTKKNGILHGVPENAGKYQATATVEDRFGNSVSSKYVFEIVPSATEPIVLTENIPAGRAADPYSLALSASGGYPPYSWSLVSGEIPEGLSLDEPGTLIGEPTSAGDWSFTLEMEDSVGQTVTPPEYSMHIYTAQGHEKFEVLTKSLPTFLSGNEIDFFPACQGGAPPYKWENLGTLPEGVELNSGGFSGTPAKTGEFELNLKASDSSGESLDVTYTLRVRKVVDWWLAAVLAVLFVIFTLLTVFFFIQWRRYAGKASKPEIKTATIPNGRASMEYCVHLSCEGGIPPYTWKLVEGELPAGLELTEDGRIFGTPYEGIGVDETVEIKFTVEVTDAAGAKSRQQL